MAGHFFTVFLDLERWRRFLRSRNTPYFFANIRIIFHNSIAIHFIFIFVKISDIDCPSSRCVNPSKTIFHRFSIYTGILTTHDLEEKTAGRPWGWNISWRLISRLLGPPILLWHTGVDFRLNIHLILCNYMFHLSAVFSRRCKYQKNNCNCKITPRACALIFLLLICILKNGHINN